MLAEMLCMLVWRKFSFVFIMLLTSLFSRFIYRDRRTFQQNVVRCGVTMLIWLRRA